MRASARFASLAAAVVALLAPDILRAQQPRTEYEVKAAYLYSFGRFVEWPPRPPARDASFAICVLGADPFGPVLDRTIEGGEVRGRRAAARRVASADEAVDCHVLFIAASEDRRLGTIVEALDRADVLTVSDMPTFVERGGMIQFVPESGRIRFAIDLPSAQQAGLRLSSELLRVATEVRQANGAGN